MFKILLAFFSIFFLFINGVFGDEINISKTHFQILEENGYTSIKLPQDFKFNELDTKIISYPYIGDGKKIVFGFNNIEEVDYVSFEVIPSILKTNIQKISSDKFKFKEYLQSGPQELNLSILLGETIEKYPSDSFLKVGSRYSKDKNYVYYLGVKIPDADTESFSIILGQSQGQYSKDKKNIYYLGKKILEADVESFAMISGQYKEIYTQDKNYIYANGINIGKTDNFKVVSGEYYITNLGVYKNGERLDIIKEPGSFELLEESGGKWTGYSKDDSNIYYGNEFIVDADKDSFSLLDYDKQNNGSWAKDKNNYFHEGKIQPQDKGNRFVEESEKRKSQRENRIYYDIKYAIIYFICDIIIYLTIIWLFTQDLSLTIRTRDKLLIPLIFKSSLNILILIYVYIISAYSFLFIGIIVIGSFFTIFFGLKNTYRNIEKKKLIQYTVIIYSFYIIIILGILFSLFMNMMKNLPS